MNLLIYSLDSSVSDAPTCILKEGEHIIGRGEPLGCNDKRASRRHACIKVENGNATITSIHQNPCFFQSANSTTLVILTKDVPKELEEGDKFGIFPDDFWYKIKFQNKNAVNSCSEINSIENMNAHEENTFNFDNKNEVSTASNISTVSLETNTNCVLGKISTDENVSNSEQYQIIDLEKSNSENVSDRDVSNVGSNNTLENDKQEIVSVNIPPCNIRGTLNSSNVIGDDQIEINNTEDADSNEISSEKVDDIKPSSSRSTDILESTSKLESCRSKCWYGSNCYRQNLDHKTEFSHPGDSDYDSDPNDVRPICRYGKNCYRKSEEHLKKYKHSGIEGKLPKKRRSNKKRNSTKKLKKHSKEGESSEDEYDFDDPFLNDDSSDAYSEESWSSESYSDCSCVSEQDDGDTTTLLKEAKRFRKRKK